MAIKIHRRALRIRDRISLLIDHTKSTSAKLTPITSHHVTSPEALIHVFADDALGAGPLSRVTLVCKTSRYLYYVCESSAQWLMVAFTLHQIVALSWPQRARTLLTIRLVDRSMAGLWLLLPFTELICYRRHQIKVTIVKRFLFWDAFGSTLEILAHFVRTFNNLNLEIFKLIFFM